MAVHIHILLVCIRSFQSVTQVYDFGLLYWWHLYRATCLHHNYLSSKQPAILHQCWCHGVNLF